MSSCNTLPKHIRVKKAIMQVHCDSNESFKYAILCKIRHEISKHCKNKSSYRNLKHKYTFECVKFPVSIRDNLPIFEEVNNISINVYGLTESTMKVYPLRMCSRIKEDHRNLLFYKESFYWIKNLSRLLKWQFSKHNKKVTVCSICLSHKQHTTKFVFSRETICYKRLNYQMFLPAVFYLQVKLPDCVYTVRYIDGSCEDYNIHEINDNNISRTFDSMAKLITTYLDEKIYFHNEPMRDLTAEQVNDFENATVCYICENAFTQTDYKTRDHSHFLGTYRGAAHNSCNLNFKVPNYIPCFIQDLNSIHKMIIRSVGKRGMKIVYRSDGAVGMITKILRVKHAKNRIIHLRFLDTRNYIDFDCNCCLVDLIDTFESIRERLFQVYGLDIAHFVTVSSFAYQAMLKYTRIKLDPVPCFDTYDFLRRGIRGGINMCVKRHSKANNFYLPGYNQADDPKYIIHIDAVSLYGFVMQNFSLPVGQFRWLNEKEVETFSLSEPPGTPDKGYILEIDVEYPTELHDRFNDLPLCAEMKEERLLFTLEKKTHYVCHYMNALQMIRYGLNVKKIHRVLEFSHSNWMKSFIDITVKSRLSGTSGWEKKLYKSIICSAFGKCLQTSIRYPDVRLVSDATTLDKYISKPTFTDRTIYINNSESDFLVGVHMKRIRMHVNKPIYVGVSVLDLAKHYMYEFYYEKLTRQFPSTKLLYTDTDSFIVEIKGIHDLYAELEKYSEDYDFSNYPHEHQLYSTVNAGKPGKFKDESAGRVIQEYVGVRCKVYTVKYASGAEKVVAAGVRRTDSDRLRFDLLKERLSAPEAVDVRRFLLGDSINTVAYGHFSLSSGGT